LFRGYWLQQGLLVFFLLKQKNQNPVETHKLNRVDHTHAFMHMHARVHPAAAAAAAPPTTRPNLGACGGSFCARGVAAYYRPAVSLLPHHSFATMQLYF
jgi:hypothetical protein